MYQDNNLRDKDREGNTCHSIRHRGTDRLDNICLRKYPADRGQDSTRQRMRRWDMDLADSSRCSYQEDNNPSDRSRCQGKDRSGIHRPGHNKYQRMHHWGMDHCSTYRDMSQLDTDLQERSSPNMRLSDKGHSDHSN